MEPARDPHHPVAAGRDPELLAHVARAAWARGRGPAPAAPGRGAPPARGGGRADRRGRENPAAAAGARAPPSGGAAAARRDGPRRSDARPGSSTVPLEQIGQSAVKRLWRQKSEEEDTGLRGRLLLRLSRPRAVGGRGRAAARSRSALARPGRAVLLLGRRPRSRLARPVLIELDAPLPVVSLLELQLRLEGAAGAAAEAGDGLLGLEVRHQLADDRDRQDLPRLPLPDHEPAAGVVLRPARVALAVLDHVAAADRARAQVGALDLHVLELVELLDRLLGEVRDVRHERRPG